jgi:serine/threonine protein phosphatase PrpC
MEDTVYCGVYDGHGPYGHLVARRVRDSLPSKLLHYWQEELAAIKDNSKESETDDSAELCDTAEMDRGSNVSSMYESAICDVEDSDRDTALFEFSENALLENLPDHNDEVVRKPPMFQPWMEAHLTAYQVMDKELRSHPLIDCFCSGTTAVTILKQGNHLVIGNVGDSRAIMGTRDENGMLKAIQLTVDLKPNLPRTCPFHFHIEKVGPYLKLFML